MYTAEVRSVTTSLNAVSGTILTCRAPYKMAGCLVPGPNGCRVHVKSMIVLAEHAYSCKCAGSVSHWSPPGPHLRDGQRSQHSATASHTPPYPTAPTTPRAAAPQCLRTRARVEVGGLRAPSTRPHPASGFASHGLLSNAGGTRSSWSVGWCGTSLRVTSSLPLAGAAAAWDGHGRAPASSPSCAPRAA